MQDKQYTSVSISVSDTYEKYVESLFDDLSSVIGFNDMNGKTYEEYVQKWKVCKEMSKS
tara:strand:+ start:199 stop:375 length:177 start_codon:yes stop_codon:yes gene_type:complete